MSTSGHTADQNFLLLRVHQRHTKKYASSLIRCHLQIAAGKGLLICKNGLFAKSRPKVICDWHGKETRRPLAILL